MFQMFQLYNTVPFDLLHVILAAHFPPLSESSLVMNSFLFYIPVLFLCFSRTQFPTGMIKYRQWSLFQQARAHLLAYKTSFPLCSYSLMVILGGLQGARIEKNWP